MSLTRKSTERGGRYLKMFDMDRFSKRLAAQLSGGMKQKLALVCALVSEPDILLLDEPTTGVDPVSRRRILGHARSPCRTGPHCIVATPYLDEAERCHRIALIHLGEILQIGTPDEFRESMHAKRIELRASDLRKALPAVEKVAGAKALFSMCSASEIAWTCCHIRRRPHSGRWKK